MAFPRVDFRVDEFIQLLAQKGNRFQHFRSMLCPCIDVASGQPDPTCPNCDRGYQYFGEEQIIAVVSGIGRERQDMLSGAVFLGSMMLTALPETKIGYHDKFVNIDSIMPFSQVMTREDDEAGDILRYAPTEIDRLIDADGVAYSEEAEDFSIVGNRLVWAEDVGPEVGTRYSIAYMCHPVWLVLSHQHMIRDTQVKEKFPAVQWVKMPVQALCKLEWLLEV